MNLSVASLRRRAWQTGVLTLVVVTSLGYLRSRPRYDIEGSVHKLRRIGNALQLYRHFQVPGMRPIPKDAVQAGLPRRLVDLLAPGDKWGLGEDIHAFSVAQPTRSLAKGSVHFTQLYWWPDTQRALGLPDMAERLRTRGEALPVMADFNMISSDEYRRAEQVRVVVLRLGGEVDLVEIPTNKLRELWRR